MRKEYGSIVVYETTGLIYVSDDPLSKAANLQYHI